MGFTELAPGDASWRSDLAQAVRRCTRQSRRWRHSPAYPPRPVATPECRCRRPDRPGAKAPQDRASHGTRPPTTTPGLAPLAAAQPCVDHAVAAPPASLAFVSRVANRATREYRPAKFRA